jgi:hypothetical protein
MQVNGYNPRFGYCHTEFQLFLSLALEAMKSQYRRCVAIEDCDWNDMEVSCCTGHGSWTTYHLTPRPCPLLHGKNQGYGLGVNERS